MIGDKLLKGILSSRTMRLSFALTVLGLIEVNARFFETYLPPWAFGILLIVIGAASAWLRIVTTLPLSQRGGS